MPSNLDDFLNHPITKTPIHPVFLRFQRWEGKSDGRHLIDFLGTKTNPKYQVKMRAATVDNDHRPNYTYPNNEQYYEWIAILDSVLRAQEQFVMLELGAGRGSWLVRAAAAIRRTSNVPVHLVGVEGGRHRFNWMLEHFSDNGLVPKDHELLHGLAGEVDGHAYFIESDDPAEAGYGDEVIGGTDDFERIRQNLKIKEKEIRVGDHVKTRRDGETCTLLPCYSLETLMEPYEKVDMIHLDVQGQEFKILNAGIEPLTKKVKTVCIGTHGEDIEDDLRILFRKHGWLPRYDFPKNSEWATDWGTITFRDGCQVWLNNILPM